MGMLEGQDPTTFARSSVGVTDGALHVMAPDPLDVVASPPLVCKGAYYGLTATTAKALFGVSGATGAVMPAGTEQVRIQAKGSALYWTIDGTTTPVAATEVGDAIYAGTSDVIPGSLDDVQVVQASGKFSVTCWGRS